MNGEILSLETTEKLARIDKVIYMLEARRKLNNKILSGQHDECQHIECEAENDLIDEIFKILEVME